jgi:hypothetical protein
MGNEERALQFALFPKPQKALFSKGGLHHGISWVQRYATVDAMIKELRLEQTSFKGKNKNSGGPGSSSSSGGGGGDSSFSTTSTEVI